MATTNTISAIKLGPAPAWCTAKQWKLIQADKMDDDEFCDLIFEKVLPTAPPLIEREVVTALDAAIMKDKYGPTRRIGLLLASDSWAELHGRIVGDRDFAVIVAAAADDIADYVDRLSELAGVLKTTCERVRISLCEREDMQAVLEEAKG